MGVVDAQVRSGALEGLLTTCLHDYVKQSPGTLLSVDALGLFDPGAAEQPGLLLHVEGLRGAIGFLADDRLDATAPQLVVEVVAAGSTAALEHRLQAYRHRGVRECVRLHPDGGAVDWFLLARREAERCFVDGAGMLRSRVFPGLWLDVAALLRGDAAALARGLQEGLRSPEHAAFVRRSAA